MRLRLLMALWMVAVAGSAAAAEYVAEARASQFDPFQTNSSPLSATILIGDPNAFNLFATAAGHSMQISGDVVNGGQVRTYRANINDLDVTFDSAINGLAVGGIINIQVPYTLTYDVDVTEPPGTFRQAVSSLDVVMVGFQGVFNVGNDVGIITLLNSPFLHLFTNQTGPFLLEPAQEDTLVTINGVLPLALIEDPGNPITIELDASLAGDLGPTVGTGTVGDGYGTFTWHLAQGQILDGVGQPLNVPYQAAQPVPMLGPLGTGALAALLLLTTILGVRRPGLLVASLGFALLPLSAHADITQQLDFTFDVSNSAPEDPVSGTIVITADDTNNNLPTSIVSIDLTIDGHVYTLGEVGFSTIGVTATLGGTVGGVAVVSGGAHDFQIIYNASTGALSFFPFVYATPTTGPWQSIAPVPEWTISTLAAPLPTLGWWGTVLLIAGLLAMQRADRWGSGPGRDRRALP